MFVAGRPTLARRSGLEPVRLHLLVGEHQRVGILPQRNHPRVIEGATAPRQVLRLVSALLMEISEEGETGRVHIADKDDDRA